jgi:hypothetical protein
MTHPTSNNPYVVANGTASTAPFIEVFLPRNPTPSDVNYQVQQRWWNTAANTEFVLAGFTTMGGILQANWQQISTGMVTVETFTGDDNNAVSPILNNIFLKGGTSGGILFTKDGSVSNQIDAQVQVDGTTITINGSDQLSVVGSAAVAKVPVDFTGASPNPVVPSATGALTFTGAQIAAGSTANVIRTESDSVNTVTIAIQRAETAGVSTIARNGVSHFNSAQFTVDANGFVSISGSSPVAIDAIDVQAGTSPVVPTAGGAVTMNGAVTAAGSIPIQTNGTGANTLAIQVQTSQAIAATDATKIGLAAFNSADFTVDANGFVSFLGTGEVSTLNGDSGTATPVAGAINVYGNTAPAATGLTFSGSGNTLALGGTLDVAHGGTGDTSFTAYSVITGGTTSTGPLQNVVGVGTANQVLTSNGAGMLPTWQSVGLSAFAVNIQTFTTSGTYTPTSGMAYCIVQMVGGGGGGGGGVGGAGTVSVGSGGGYGEYASGIFSAASIGASQTVTIGAGGTGGSGGGGGNGGITSLGVLITADGGVGGAASSAGSSVVASGGSGGAGGSGGSYRFQGAPGVNSLAIYSSIYIPGNGGSGIFGGGGETFWNQQASGNVGVGYGSGGSGSTSTTANTAGGNGANGIVIITEYIT